MVTTQRIRLLSKPSDIEIVRIRISIVAITIAVMTIMGTVMLEADDTLLARVGDRTITEADLRAFEKTIEVTMWPNLTSTQRDSALLRTLIDKTVLLAEAEARKIENELWFSRKLQAEVEAFAVKRYRTMQIARRVSITMEEMEEHFRASHRDRALRYAGILVDTEDEVHALLDRLSEGADFAKLAREHSLFEQTRDDGGDMGKYLLKDETDLPIQPIYELEVGAVSEPLAAPFLGGNRKYAIFKILDALPVGVESAIDEVKEELFQRKRTERTKVVVDSLTVIYEPLIDKGGIAAVASRVAKEGLTDEVATMPLLTYTGGAVTVEELIAITSQGDGSIPPDLTNSTWIDQMLRLRILDSILFLEAAKPLGLHNDASADKWRQREREDMLISTLKKREVDARIPEISEQEARRFYDENSQKFKTWAEVTVKEILAPDREQAQALRAQLERGADAGELAGAHSTRAGLDHQEWVLTLNKGTQYRYGTALFASARQLAPGEIGGPVELEDGFSVFKVITNEPASVKPYNENSQMRAKAYLRVDRFRRAFVEFVRILWDKQDVEVFVDYP